MQQLTRDDLVAAGANPPAPGEEVRDAETRIKRVTTSRFQIFRRFVHLSDEQKETVRKVMDGVLQEWAQNTANLRSRLRRANDLMEGIKEPKDFPWPGSSNLHIPVIESHVTILHSVVSQTMLEMSPIWYVKTLLENVPDEVDPAIEKFLDWVSRTEMQVDQTLSDIYWNAYKDGTAIGSLDWEEEYRKIFDIEVYRTIEEFQSRYPSADEAGISPKKYDSYLTELEKNQEDPDWEGLQIRIEQQIPSHIGPRLRVVDLENFVMVPVTSPKPDYAVFAGDLYIQRADYFRRVAKLGYMDKTEVEKMIKSEGLTTTPDMVSQAQDTIEGISRTRITKADEYQIVQGILNIDLDGDNIEEKYIIKYHKDTKAILWMEHYPYWHNRSKYIAWRFKRRPNRFLGQSIYEQLADINEEIDTQHNQRIDSRTITTVPSFKKLDGIDFDPTRQDQKFYPGVTFKLSNLKSLEQFDIKQTDLGSSLQEEQSLNLIADTRTGASQLRSGREAARDPRAPAKKIALMISQSNLRIDDHMRELRYGTVELGSQILELYYQFGPEKITYGELNPNSETSKFVAQQIARSKLRSTNMVLEVARTSILDSPENVVQRQLMTYQILSREPLIGQVYEYRRQSLVRLLRGMRERNPDQLVPTLEQAVQELAKQQQIMNQGTPAAQNLMATIADAKGERQPPDGGTRPRGPDARASHQSD